MAMFTIRSSESILGSFTSQIVVAGGRDMHWERLRAFAVSASHAAANLLAQLRLSNVLPYPPKRVVVPVMPGNVECTRMCRSTAGQGLWRFSGTKLQRID